MQPIRTPKTLVRRRYIQNGQMWTGYFATPEPLTAKAIRLIHMTGELRAGHPNNWLRRILYFFGAPRRLTRSV